MARKLLTECPYCHRKVSYFGAGILKTRGEHSCKGCKCISNVVIHRALYGIGGGAVVLSLIFVLVLSTYMEHDNIWGIVIVLLPYLIFYILSPFFIKLEPCNDKSAVNRLKRKLEPVPSEKKHTVKKQDRPIELNVGEQFRSSFMEAKSSVKTEEDNFSEEYSESLSPTDNIKMDITSGIDIDISADVQNTNSSLKNETDKVNVKTNYESTPESDKSKNEVSFLFGNTASEEEKVVEDPIPLSDDNNEVSFLFGGSENRNDS